MMFVVRLHPRCEIESVWNWVDKAFSGKKSGDVVPLYVSQREDQHYVDTILEAKDVEVLAEFLIKHIPKCREIDDTRTVTIMKPAFYPVPARAGKDVKRFAISISVDPRNYRTVYDRLLKMKVPEGVYLNYVAYEFGDDDIVISSLAKNWTTIRKFVRERIRNLPGVTSAKPHLICRSKRLASKPVWTKHQKKYSVEKMTGVAPEDKWEYDWTFIDECVVSGALPDEV
ncbi:MAG: Lrp/AsnC ligand binding domain-containing protein [Candidatus Thermoplasmatota archaeon]|nr:Lrp/AsnC ligand binding domain-containing protein [Candidatus Thermoplasmatota archaeon]